MSKRAKRAVRTAPQFEPLRVVSLALIMLGIGSACFATYQLYGVSAAIKDSYEARANAIMAAAVGKDEARLAALHRADIQKCMREFTEYQCIAMMRGQ